jgi:pyruvate dehydrogenase E1 component
MVTDQEDVFYYITVMNENYTHPALPAGAEGGILKGMYRFKEGGKHKLRAQLLGSGTILREVIAAAELLEAEWKVSAEVWSVPSFTELRREGLDADRWNLLHPEEPPREPYVTRCLGERPGPVVAATDYVKAYED